VKQWLGTLARLVVGGVWLAAGLLKVSDGAASVRAVRAYQLLPESVVPTVGHALPALEIVIGLALVAGALTRAAAVGSSLLFVAFIIGISSAWARGLQIECGCFGGGGFDADATSKYPWEIARDAGLLLLSLWLVWQPRTRLALDSLIFRPLTPAPERPEHVRDPADF
jgi:uncharacterized membrane protein YphA (DoxX/SURF4 family)